MTATVAGLLDDVAAARPDQRLLLDVDGGVLTVADVARLSTAGTRWLADSGVRPGMTVAWQLPSHSAAAVLMLALDPHGLRASVADCRPTVRDSRQSRSRSKQCVPDEATVAHGGMVAHIIKCLFVLRLAVIGQQSQASGTRARVRNRPVRPRYFEQSALTRGSSLS